MPQVSLNSFKTSYHAKKYVSRNRKKMFPVSGKDTGNSPYVMQALLSSSRDRPVRGPVRGRRSRCSIHCRSSSK